MSMDEFFPETMVINLKSRPERLKRFKEANENLLKHSTLTVLEASDGKDLVANKGHSHKLKSDGHYGCLLSHRRIWEKVKKMPNGKWVLVAEDDARIDPRFLKDWKKIEQDAREQGANIIIFYVGNNNQPNLLKQVKTKFAPSDATFTGLVPIRSHFSGLVFYAVNNRGASKLYNESSLKPKSAVTNSDTAIARLCKNGKLDVYTTEGIYYSKIPREQFSDTAQRVMKYKEKLEGGTSPASSWFVPIVVLVAVAVIALVLCFIR